MKSKSLIIAAVLLLPAWLNGQNLDDALRYSQTFIPGTARYNGMGGAFTALGGDFTAIMVNPASAAIFRSTEVSVTPLLSFRNTSSDYMNSSVSSQSSYFNMGQIGLVSSAVLGKGSGLTGISLAYTYNQTNNLNKSYTINGISDDSSIADYFAACANTYNTWELADNTPEGYMGYYTYLTDTVSGQYTDYLSVFSYYGEQPSYYDQRTIREIDNVGNTGEHTIAAAANWGDKLYLGAAFGIASISYTGHYYHTEDDESLNNPWFKDLSYTDHFNANGTGLNFKMGLIVKPVEMLRLGLSFQTPTVYRISEVYYKILTASYDVDMNGTNDGGYDFDIQKDPDTYDYKIRTPYRLNAGVALQLGTIALLSADYEYVDYPSARLDRYHYDDDFDLENEDLQNELKSATNLRLGAELRLGMTYIRGGYRHYGSAFQAGKLNEGLVYNMYSMGLGYRQKNFYIDLAFSGMLSSEFYKMYPDYEGGLAPAYIDNSDKTLIATVGLKF